MKALTKALDVIEMIAKITAELTAIPIIVVTIGISINLLPMAWGYSYLFKAIVVVFMVSFFILWMIIPRHWEGKGPRISI